MSLPILFRTVSNSILPEAHRLLDRYAEIRGLVCQAVEKGAIQDDDEYKCRFDRSVVLREHER